jgi:superfamily II DNA/RNA helicase
MQTIQAYGGEKTRRSNESGHDWGQFPGILNSGARPDCFGENPIRLTTPGNTPAARVKQVIHLVDRRRKRELLSHRIGAENWQQVLVFTRTKHGANRLASQLTDDGLKAMAIHGNKSQAARTRALKDFKAGAVRVLVATDVAARGLDIDRLPHVVNYELPNVPEDYLHRIGRTARAGQEGHAVSLVCIDEHELLRNIERLLKCEIEEEIIPGYQPDPCIMAEPIQKRRARRPVGQHAGARQNGRTSAPHVRRGQRRRSSSRRRRASYKPLIPGAPGEARYPGHMSLEPCGPSSNHPHVFQIRSGVFRTPVQHRYAQSSMFATIAPTVSQLKQ